MRFTKFAFVCMLSATWMVSTPMTSQSFADDISKEEMSTLKAKFKRPDKIPYPASNPYSEAKETLGYMLFFDPRLSGSQMLSCSSCHNPSFNWGDINPKSVGNQHKVLGRKSMSVLNLAWDDLMFWDGRAEGLEEQALGPIASPGEMGMDLNAMIGNLNSMHAYKPLFEKAFPGEKDPITKENVAKAIATFERGVVSGEAPFDRWVNGDEKAISDEAKRGFVLFNKKANCVACHSSWRFSDGSYHDIGLADESDVGRYKHLEMPAMKHAFKTVGLRNIAQRAPYMHNGVFNNLEDVIEHYNGKFTKRPSLSENVKPLNLTDTEKKELVAFLGTLTSKDKPMPLPVLPR